jgi:hypothetical protein
VNRSKALPTPVRESLGDAVAVSLPVLGPDSAEVPIDTPSLLNLYETGSKTALSKLRKRLLVVLCAVKLSRSQNFDSMQKGQLLDQLHEAVSQDLISFRSSILNFDFKRLADGIIDEDGGLAGRHASKKTNVLGKLSLEEVRSDMEKLKLPTWFKTAPKHPGDVRWGKFKADEWKAFCTVNLPITLTRLWGLKPKHDRQYQMLENFLHLVTAVTCANQRKLTDDTIKLYDLHISAYLNGFVQLFPFANITPYQHLSLHFSSHLRRWGPTHSWRCFAFERYNGVLQALPTNNKFGLWKIFHDCNKASQPVSR